MRVFKDGDFVTYGNRKMIVRLGYEAGSNKGLICCENNEEESGDSKLDWFDPRELKHYEIQPE